MVCFVWAPVFPGPLGPAGWRPSGSDPQIRLLLANKTIQIELFAEQVRKAEADRARYLLRKIAERNQLVEHSGRRKPEADLAALKLWMARHKIVQTADPQTELRALELADCFVIVTDLPTDNDTTQRFAIATWHCRT